MDEEGVVYEPDEIFYMSEAAEKEGREAINLVSVKLLMNLSLFFEVLKLAVMDLEQVEIEPVSLNKNKIIKELLLFVKSICKSFEL